jgi:hypothetical protein
MIDDVKEEAKNKKVKKNEEISDPANMRNVKFSLNK